MTTTETHIPKCYVVVTHYTTCCACGTTTVSSEFFARTTIRARFAQGANVTHLEHAASPRYNLPVEHVALQRTTAFCIRCHKIDLSHLPPPPSAAQLYDLAEPVHKLAHNPRKAASPKPTPVKLSIKDLA